MSETVTVGLEYHMSEKVSARVEYRYSDYGTVNDDNPGWHSMDHLGYSTHAVRVGVGYSL